VEKVEKRKFSCPHWKREEDDIGENLGMDVQKYEKRIRFFTMMWKRQC